MPERALHHQRGRNRQCGRRPSGPGYEFPIENAAFAEVCETSGIKFIGPRPEVIRTMGAKERARALLTPAQCTGNRRTRGTERKQ